MSNAAVAEKPDTSPAPTPAAAPTPQVAPETENKAAPEAPAPAASPQDKPAGETAPPAKAATDSDEGLIGDDAAPGIEWPDDWREQMAAGDEKELNRLKRMKTPADVYKFAREIERKVSSGEYKKTLPENATDEQKAEWRAANGIPDSPDKYVVPTIEGVVFSDDDKPIVDKFLAKMHSKDASQAHIEGALEAYGEILSEQMAARKASNLAFKAESEKALQSELGDDYKGSLAIYRRVLEDNQALPDGLGELLVRATDDQGRRLVNHPAVAKFLINLGREKYGDGAMVTGDGRTASEGREAEIKMIMKTDYKRYIAEGLDKEYAKIIARKHGNTESYSD